MNNQQILDEKKAIENRFAELNEQKKQVEEELYRLQGEYRLLERLEPKTSDEEVTTDEPAVTQEDASNE